MTINVEESVQSRDAEIGLSSSANLVYYAFCDGGEDEIAAHAAVVAQAPLTYRSIPARGSSIKLLVQGPSLTVYEVTCKYILDQKQTQTSDPDTAEYNATLSFNLVGGTQHITTALSTTSHRLFADGPTVDVKNVIGLDLKTGQVRGVDVFAPVMDFSYVTRFPNSALTADYIRSVYELTGTVNDSAFKGSAAGEVIFKGARGSKKGQDEWELSFEFAYSPNKTDIVIGGITVDKKGWEYLDVMYKEDTTNTIGNKPIQVPAQVNVHKVYEDGDFSLLQIGV